MATLTVTLTANMRLQAVPRAAPNGGITSVAFVSGARTFGGAGDTMMLAKIPNKARILGLGGHVTTANNGNVIARLLLMRSDSIGGNGTLGTLSIMSEVMGTSTIVAAGNDLGRMDGLTSCPVVSLSDDAAVQFAVLALVAVGGTQSTSFSIDGVVMYETYGSET